MHKEHASLVHVHMYIQQYSACDNAVASAGWRMIASDLLATYCFTYLWMGVTTLVTMGIMNSFISL